MPEDHDVLRLESNKAAEIVRVGDTVRRSVGPWSPIAHSLLRHLESKGLNSVPRFIGIDSAGREVLSFHPGMRMSDAPDLSHDDELLTEVARLVRGFHDASTGFVPPQGSPRWEGPVDPAGGILVLHGDLAPWNVIVGEGGLTLIDWDDVWVGRAEWEIAYVLHTFVPMWSDALSDHDTVRRVEVFADAYGLPRHILRDAIDLIPARCRRMGETNRARAAMGDPVFVRAVAHGIDVTWMSCADHVAKRLPTWRRQLAL